MSKATSNKSTHKILASVALVVAAAGVAGLGTFGSFSSSTSASQAVDSGTVSIVLGASGAGNRLSVAATGLVPGDTVQRAVSLSNNGDQNLNAVTLTTSASPSSKLDTDVTNGLKFKIESCSVAWTETGTAPAYTYSCSGTKLTVLAERPIIGANVALSNVGALTAAKTDNLVVTATLPATADNTFQGLSSTVNFAFNGTQRTATNK